MGRFFVIRSVGRWLLCGVEGPLLLFLQLDYYDFDWLVSRVNVGVHGVWRVRGEPVGFARLPDVNLFGAALIDDVHGAAGDGYDDARMLVPVHGERRVGKD
jgi:hypothetical protein